MFEDGISDSNSANGEEVPPMPGEERYGTYVALEMPKPKKKKAGLQQPGLQEVKRSGRIRNLTKSSSSENLVPDTIAYATNAEQQRCSSSVACKSAHHKLSGSQPTSVPRSEPEKDSED